MKRRPIVYGRQHLPFPPLTPPTLIERFERLPAFLQILVICIPLDVLVQTPIRFLLHRWPF